MRSLRIGTSVSTLSSAVSITTWPSSSMRPAISVKWLISPMWPDLIET